MCFINFTFSYDSIFFGIIVSASSITISSIPEEKIRVFPIFQLLLLSSPTDPRKNLVFPIRTSTSQLPVVPPDTAYVWTFYDPQTDLTNDKRTKTISFPFPFDVHTYPDYDLPKPPVRHNHLLDHKLSPLLLSPCFCLSCVCPPRLATPRLRLIDIQRGRGEGVGSIDRFNRRISKRGVKGSPLVAPIPRRAREKPSLHVSRYSVPRRAYGRLSPA